MPAPCSARPRISVDVEVEADADRRQADAALDVAIGHRQDRRVARVAVRREAVGEEDHARFCALGSKRGDREVEAGLEAVVDVGRAARREAGDDLVELRAIERRSRERRIDVDDLIVELDEREAIAVARGCRSACGGRT